MQVILGIIVVIIAISIIVTYKWFFIGLAVVATGCIIGYYVCAKKKLLNFAQIEPATSMTRMGSNISTPTAKENDAPHPHSGKKTATAKRIELDDQSTGKLKVRFIAFDVETTGLSPNQDRIVEIGAVSFREGKVDKTFSSLVNPRIPMPTAATSVNHITDDMLADAPNEEEAYPKFLEFLGDALCGETIICAHNAQFDLSFLCNTLSRLGIEADFEYIDTLALARKHLHGLENYKQGTIEAYFGLSNPAAHRAVSDAETCGQILLRLMDAASEAIEQEAKEREKARPTAQELEVCAYIQDILVKKGGDVRLLRFKRGSGGYVTGYCLYSFVKFKFAKKGKYILVESNCTGLDGLKTEPCTKSEGNPEFLRVFFSGPSDLEPLTGYLYQCFTASYDSMMDYISYGKSRRTEVENISRSMFALTENDVRNILNSAEGNTIPG